MDGGAEERQGSAANVTRPKLLVVAPGINSRGGVVSVVRLHMELSIWKEMRAELLPTYADTSVAAKMWASFSAYVRAPWKVLEADVVHIHLAGQLSLMRKLPIIAIVRLLRRSLIVHLHASSPESLFEKTPGWAVRYVLEQADSVVVLSASWAGLIKSRLPGAKVSIIPNPVRVFATNKRVVERDAIVLFVGKLEARKGYRILLDAAPLVLQKHPETQFWFAGHGELDEAAEHAAALGITSSVRFLGWTEAEDTARLYEEATVVCLPSYAEGVPMVILEAMSHGTPVVCTPVGGVTEFVFDGESGLIAEIGSARSTAEKILQYLNDPSYASTIAATASRNIQQRCGLPVVDDELRRLYQRLTGDEPFDRSVREFSENRIS